MCVHCPSVCAAHLPGDSKHKIHLFIYANHSAQGKRLNIDRLVLHKLNDIITGQFLNISVHIFITNI